MANKVFNDVKVNVAFTPATTRENIVSGENISKMAGKISKVIDDLTDTAFTGDAETVNGHTVETDVPSNAKFTDTTYNAAGSALGLVKTGGDVTISDGVISINNNSHDHSIDNISGLQTALNNKLDTSLKGASGGIAELDNTGKVPASQLPSYVDDVIEGYLSSGKFYKESAHTTQITGETGKIYVDLASSKTYRWSGSTFVVISESLALGETSSTAYRGDRGKTAYDHSQLTSGNPHNVTKADVGLGNVENKSSATILGELTKANVTDALGYTPPETDTKYTHPTTAGNKHIPSGGSSGQILRWSADGTAVWGADTDTKMNMVLNQQHKAYILGTRTTPTTTVAGVTSVADPDVYINDVAGEIVAKSFQGKVSDIDNRGNRYTLIGDNNANLWIGASQSAGYHHEGMTYISTGYNSSTGKGYETIRVGVPNEGNDSSGSTVYDVIHTGNIKDHVTTESIKALPNKTGYAYYNSSTTEKKWYKVADMTAPLHASSVDTISFLVSNSNVNYGCNLLTITTTYTDAAISSINSKWTAVEHTLAGLSENFVAVGYVSGSNVVVELWVGIPTGWHSYFFRVVMESSRSAEQDRWKLYKTTEGQSTYNSPTGAVVKTPSISSAIYVDNTLPTGTSETTYNIPYFASSSSAGSKKLIHNSAFRYKMIAGTTTIEGLSTLHLGNATAVGSDGNQTGRLTMYDKNGKYGNLQTTELTANRLYNLPDKSGTIALTDDLTDNKVLQSNSDAANYRPLVLGYTNDPDTSKLNAATTNQVYVNTKLYTQPSTGTIFATKFSGSGESLTSLNASNISSGTLNSDRLPTVPIAKGGTGATTALAAQYNILNSMSTGITSEINDDTQLLFKLATISTSNGFACSRKASYLWTYIKSKTDALYNNYTHPTTAGNKHIPSGGSSGQILRWSADGTAVWGADTDTKMNVVANAQHKAYILGTRTTPTSTATGVTAVADTSIYINDVAGEIVAKSFNGKMTAIDSKDNRYTLIGDNNANLWIGASQSTSYHHEGATYISTGYDTTNGKGNETIRISVPKDGNDGSGSNVYYALHSGNYMSYDGHIRHTIMSQPSASASSTPWFKIASYTSKTTSDHAFITMAVSSGLTASQVGILHVKIATASTVGTNNSCTARWISSASGIDPSDFVVTYTETTGTSVTYDIWCKLNQQWKSFIISVINEGTRTSYGQTWTLSEDTSTGLASYGTPTGIVESIFTVTPNPVETEGEVKATKFVGPLEGTATSASKLTNTSAIGSATNPVYFNSSGVPVKTTYTLEASVPSGAKFTDTWTALKGATSTAAGTAGYAPAPPSSGYNTKYLRADGTWAVPPNTEYTHPSYTARTGVPTANATPAFGGTFSVSQVTSDETGHVTGMTSRTITIPGTTMGAATSSAAGTKGLVPAPAAGKQTSFLRGDGTWSVPSDTKMNVVENAQHKAYILGTRTTPTSTATGVTAVADTDIYLSDVAGEIVAKSFQGKMTAIDSLDQRYTLIGDNNANLWIGATQSTGYHHEGMTYISTGYDSTAGKGNETIRISVPNDGNDNSGSTIYYALHDGNYKNYVTPPNIGALRDKTGYAYYNSSTDGKKWYKVADATLPLASSSVDSITFIVSNGNTNQGNGLLTITTSYTASAVSSVSAKWSSVDHTLAGLSDNFVAVGYVSGSNVVVELWVGIPTGWHSYFFRVVMESSRSSATNRWKLYKTTDGETTYNSPTGAIVKTSTVTAAVYVDNTLPTGTTSTPYNIPYFEYDTTAGPKKLTHNSAFRYSMVTGTTSTEGKASIYLGNSKAAGTDGNETGRILFYGDTTNYGFLQPITGLSGTRTWSLPNKTGTIALTDDITDVAVKQSSSSTANYRPLAMGFTTNADVSKLAATVTSQIYLNTQLYTQPSTGMIFANRFVTNSQELIYSMSGSFYGATTIEIDGLFKKYGTVLMTFNGFAMGTNNTSTGTSSFIVPLSYLKSLGSYDTSPSNSMRFGLGPANTTGDDLGVILGYIDDGKMYIGLNCTFANGTSSGNNQPGTINIYSL